MVNLRKIRPFAAAAVLALSAGCSEADTESDAAPLARTYDQDYLVFASHEEAVRWLEAFAPKLAVMGKNVESIVSADDPRVKRAEAIVAGHWPTFRRLYGPNIPKPRVLMFETDAPPNAFIPGDPATKKVVDAVVFQANIMDAMDETSLDATIAHELGHLAFKHLDDRYAAAATRYYRVTGEETLGMNRSNDPAVEQVIESWFEDTSLVGSYPVKELNGVPLSDTAVGLPVFFQKYVAKKADPQNASCLRASQSYRAAVAAFASGVRRYDMKWTATPEQLEALNELTKPIAADVAACVPVDQRPLSEAMAETIGAPVEVFEESFRADDRAAIEGKDVVTAAFVLSARSQARVRTVRESPQFTSYRVYTTEEQADDIAMTVLDTEGKDPAAVGGMVAALLSPPEREACSAEISVGRVPNFGIEDAHHSACYRLYHAKAFVAHLRSGKPGVTKDQMPHIDTTAVETRSLRFTFTPPFTN